jgi:UDP-GlcNAc:undecaprenyl-phosphate GlcNAc-1-phosphate transferase
MKLLILIVAALLAAGLAPVVRRIAMRFGIQDQPGSTRKIHARVMPRVGGLAILAGTFVAVLTALALGAEGSERILAFPRPILGLSVAALVVATFGLLDDIYDLSPYWNLAAQAVAAVISWEAGFRCERLEWLGRPIDLGAASFLITVLFFMTLMNALNMVDGLDGLAAALSLLALLVLLAQSILDGGPVASVLGLALAGGIAGFLVENLHPARQFMGSCGSQLIGLLLAALAVGTLRGRQGFDPVIPLLAMAMPLLDLTLAILRRALRGVNPLRGDREHLHHRLIDRGWSQGRAVLALSTIQAVFTVLGLIALALPARWSFWPAVPAVVLAITIATLLGSDRFQRRTE